MTIKLPIDFDPELDYDIWYHTLQNGKIEQAKEIQGLLLKKYPRNKYPDLHMKFKTLPTKTQAVQNLPMYDVYPEEI